MHRSLLLSLPGLAVASLGHYPSNTTASIVPSGIPQHNITQEAQHLADLQHQVQDLKDQLSSKLAEANEACQSSTSVVTVTTFTAAPSTGLPTATNLPHLSSFVSQCGGSFTRLEPTFTKSYASEASVIISSLLGSVPGPTYAPHGSSSAHMPWGSSQGASSSAASASMSKSSGAPVFYSQAPHSNSTWASTGVMPTGVSTCTSSTKAASTYVPALSDFSAEQVASGEAWRNVSSVALERQSILESNGTCTYENARVRTEFRSMSNAQRKAFTDAVTCLKNTSPHYTTAGSAEYPGVMSRYDEYVATHINMTYHIHGTADFLAWHRNFIWEFETDLNTLCGYTGTLPYWNWAEDAAAVDKSEVFNGDEYSLGGNGVYIPGRNYTYMGLQNVNFPPGTGGGCVTEGPFNNATFRTTLGPIDSPYGNNVNGSFDYNPRCLIRDLNTWFSSQYNTYTNLTDLVLGETSIQYFQSLMQGGLGDNKFGVHGGGHWLGGGPSQLEDFHSSPNDPLFYTHHAMIDFTWCVWQYLDISVRQNAIYGTSTLDNSPASADMSLDETLSFGFVGDSQVFSSLMSTFKGRFCYRYE